MSDKFKIIMEKEQKEIANSIDEFLSDLGFFLIKRREFLSTRRESLPQSHLVYAMGLMLSAAHEILHDDGKKEDFLALCEAAWEKSSTVHKKECSND